MHKLRCHACSKLSPKSDISTNSRPSSGPGAIASSRLAYPAIQNRRSLSRVFLTFRTALSSCLGRNSYYSTVLKGNCVLNVHSCLSGCRYTQKTTIKLNVELKVRTYSFDMYKKANWLPTAQLATAMQPDN